MVHGESNTGLAPPRNAETKKNETQLQSNQTTVSWYHSQITNWTPPQTNATMLNQGQASYLLLKVFHTAVLEVLLRTYK